MLKQLPSAHGAAPSLITCGWCGTHYTLWESRCTSCGGPMPPPPGMSLGEEPPPAPRDLPKGFVTRQLWLGNAGTLVGGIFCLVGIVQFLVFVVVMPWIAFFPALFIIGGGLLLRHGRKRARKLISAYRDGRPVKGTITEVGIETSYKINGRSPWRITYAYTAADGQRHEGIARTFDSSAQSRQTGQPIWVLVNDHHPEESTIYPPVK